MDRIVVSSSSRDSLLSTHKVLRNTYFLLSLTLAFSALTATASTMLGLPAQGLLLMLVGFYGLMFLTHKLANSPAGILAAFALTGFMGYALGPNPQFVPERRRGRPDHAGAGRHRSRLLLLLGVRADHP